MQTNYGIAQQIANQLRRVPGTADVRVQQMLGLPTLHLDIDRNLVTQVGMNPLDIAQSVLVSLSGSFQTAPASGWIPKTVLPIRWWCSRRNTGMTSLQDLMNMPVNDRSVPNSQVLGNLVQLSPTSRPAVVSHYGIEPVIDVYASTQGRDLGAVARETQKLLHPGDAETVALLRAIDDAPTRRAVAIERALLAQRGGGCHQRFGATQIEVPGLGTLLYLREGERARTRSSSRCGAAALDARAPLEPPPAADEAWDGSRAERAARRTDRGRRRAQRASALSGATRRCSSAHRRALPAGRCRAHQRPAAHVWVPGIDTWQALAERGVWVEGCAEGLGFARARAAAGRAAAAAAAARAGPC